MTVVTRGKHMFVTMATVTTAMSFDVSRLLMDRCRRHCDLKTYMRDDSRWRLVLVRIGHTQCCLHNCCTAVHVFIAHAHV